MLQYGVGVPSRIRDGELDAVVFHAQQCIEKLMKGALVEAGIGFPRTHELNILAHLVV